MARFDYESAVKSILDKAAPLNEIDICSWGAPQLASYVWLREEGDALRFLICCPDSVAVGKVIEMVKSEFEKNEYTLADEKSIDKEFLNNKIELTFIDCHRETPDERQEAIRKELMSVAQKHNLLFRAILNIRGGRGWINYSQVEANDYTVQVSTSGNFQEYDNLRTDISEVFERHSAILVKEYDDGKRAFGFQKELQYWDKTKVDMTRAEKDMKQEQPITLIQTQITGSIDTGGGNLNTGNAATIDNSTITSPPETKWFQKEIVKMILSFIGGVGATLFAQWIMRLWGWI